MNALRAGFANAISTLSATLTTEASELQETRRQSETKTERLAALHGLVVTEDTLDALIQEYQEKAATFEEQARQETGTFEQEMRTKRQSWQLEQQGHNRAVKQRDDVLKKERQREAKEYEYALELQRQAEAEGYAQERQSLRRELAEFVEAKGKEWTERESAVAAKEHEYEELRARVEAFPKELDTAIRRAQKEAIDTVQAQAKVREDLLAKEEEGNKRIAELKIQSLEETIRQQAQRIDSLSAQLEAVVRQDQDLAIKAIEGASQATSFQSIREIALEQAKQPPKSK